MHRTLRVVRCSRRSPSWADVRSKSQDSRTHICYRGFTLSRSQMRYCLTVNLVITKICFGLFSAGDELNVAVIDVDLRTSWSRRMLVQGGLRQPVHKTSAMG